MEASRRAQTKLLRLSPTCMPLPTSVAVKNPGGIGWSWAKWNDYAAVDRGIVFLKDERCICIR